jgi:hypothetical protein
MSDSCPNCGAQYSETVTVEMGDRYKGVFGSTPRSLLTEFIRICPAPESSQRAARESHVDIEVFLHRLSDLGGDRSVTT